ncbi:MAG: hypothetical protein ACLR6B_06650 [Blautia sp.]
MKENIPEEGLEHFDEYLQNYSRNENHPLKILMGFYKGKKLQCLKGFSGCSVSVPQSGSHRS